MTNAGGSKAPPATWELVLGHSLGLGHCGIGHSLPPPCDHPLRPSPRKPARFQTCRRPLAPVSLETIKTARSNVFPLRPQACLGLALSAWTGWLHAAETNAAAALVAPSTQEVDPNEPLLLALNIAAVVCFVVWWIWMGRRKTGVGSLQSIPGVTGAAEPWAERALAAEARAEKATALLRARLMPQMARWMMGELIQRLLAHRSDLVHSQQRAEDDVAELEKRLEKIHAPLAERLAAYEKRIAELERDLAAKGEENRELIEAKIELARKKLATERAKDPLKWN